MARFFKSRFFGNAAVLAPPAVPSLAMSDNADGTGAVATVASADSGTTNTVYVQAFNGDLGTGDWTSKGSRTGNGTIAVSLATAGHYLAYLTSSDGSGGTSVSAVVYFVVTTGADATHYQCLVATQAVIQSLLLDGIANSSVVVKKIPLDRILGPQGISYPGVLVTPARETMDHTAGLNRLDDVGYGVLITMLDADNQEPTVAANINKYLTWRQRISKAFRNQRLSGVPEIIIAFVDPIEMVMPEAWNKQLWASSLLVRFISRESRGLS